MSALTLLKQTRRTQSLKGAAAAAWSDASEKLGLQLQRHTASARGNVRCFEVGIALVGTPTGVHTQYAVRFDAPHVPEFHLTQSPQAADVIDLNFEQAVSIVTNDEQGILDFLNKERRTTILHTLALSDHVTITNQHVVVATEGIEDDVDMITSTVEQLIALADAVEPCWAEMRLDEGAVLNDLFNSSRDREEIAKRFDAKYKASEVTWTGEVVQVGSVEKHGRRVAVFVGSASKPEWAAQAERGTLWAGRVMAMTHVDPDQRVEKGDVITFTGALRNLDAAKRLFRIEDYATMKLRDPLFG